MKEDYHQQNQDSPPFMEKEYYRVVEDTPSKGFTVEECYKVVGDTPINGFTAEEFYKITNGPEAADSFEDLDKAPEGEETLKVEEDKVVKEVCDYFSKTIFDHQNLSSVPKVSFPVGPVKNCEVDVVLRGSESQPFVAIAECKGSDGANYGRRQLLGYLCANNTRFGLFANSLNPDNWIFYENLRHFRFRLITRSQFENEVISGNHYIETAESKIAGFTENPNMETLVPGRLPKNKVESKVKAYFSEIISQNWEYSLEKNREIQIGSEKKPRIADFVLRGRDGSFIAIVDTEYRESKNVKGSILHTLLSATDTKFGIIAHSADQNKWKFVRKLGINHFENDLEPEAFGAMVVAQAKEAACPVFKGQELSKKEWNQYSKTWKTLKSEHFWRVTEVFHPDCSFRIGEEISNVDYQRAREDYQYSVKNGNILTKAKLAKIREIWPNLVVKSVWRVTEVFHSRCSLTAGQYVSQIEYKQARVDYPGCLVKKGDVLTKAELIEHRKTWNNLKVEKIWCITDADYQQAQQRIRDEWDLSQSVIRLWQSIWGIASLECRQAQDERDKSQSKIKLWKFVTASVGFFLLCFGGLFLVQRNAAEDAVHQNAVLASHLDRKESEIRRKDLETRSLTISVQTLKNENETLREEISELENRERNRVFPTNTTSIGIVSLRRQLNEEKNENQKLENQLVKKDAEIRQLQNDKAVALSESRKLKNQLVDNRQGVTNQNITVGQLQSENQELQNRNQNLIRQNQRLREEKKLLQSRLIIAKQNGSSKESGNDRSVDLVLPEPLKQIDEYKDEVPLASVKYTNHGIEAFKLKDYDNAVDFFRDAVQVDLTFAKTHYNLGCVYLEIREYDKAIKAFGEAVAVNSDFKEAYYNSGLAHLGKGARQAAKSSVKLALRIDKNYQRARNLLTTIENAQR